MTKRTGKMLNKMAGAVSPITLWYRKSEKNVYEYNHLEEGHCKEGVERPAPKTEAHKSAWSKGQWAHEHAFFDSSVPPKVLNDPREHIRGMPAEQA
jgi:hypothetical protein